MKVYSKGIVNGKIEKKYGKYGTEFNVNGIPSCSLPICIEDAPEGTQTFALILEDKDAIPICGFSWIHWTAANIKRTELSDNESRVATDFVQGVNSFYKKSQGHDRAAYSFYGGMAPPDAPHTYELHVYALDQELALTTGFYMNELYWKMQGHILDSFTLFGVYDN
jgi:Raf kinase inhibitor-like YbhB/YbcL family protein